MNELLGLYGYEKVAVSDIGKLQNQSSPSENKDFRNHEAVKAASPSSSQSNPSRGLLSK